MKFLKIFGIVVGVIVLVAVISGVLLVKLVNLNSLKPMIIEQVYKATGKKLTLTKDISLNIFPSLGVEFKQAALSSVPGLGNKPFVEIDDAKVSVKLLPLLQRKIELKQIVADGVDFSWQNKKTGQNVSINNLCIKVDGFNTEDFFPIKLSFAVHSSQPKIDGNVTATGKLKADMLGHQYQVQNFAADIKLQGAGLPDGKLEAKLNSDNVLVNSNQLQIKSFRLIRGKDLVTGSIDVSGFNQAANSNALGALRKIKMQAQIATKHLMVGSLSVNQGKMILNAQDGVIKAEPITAKLYGGDFNGSATVNLQQETAKSSLQFDFSDFQVQSLLNDLSGINNFIGTGNLQANINAGGVDSQSILSTLNGKIKFSLRKGALRGINLGSLIYAGREALGGKAAPPKNDGNQTNFDSITGTVTLADGIASNEDLTLVSNNLQAQGSGTANFVTQKLNYTLEAGLKGKLKKWSVPIVIKGDLLKPEIQLDMKTILRNIGQQIFKGDLSKVQIKIGNFLIK
jgi:AsmA protein